MINNNKQIIENIINIKKNINLIKKLRFIIVINKKFKILLIIIKGLYKKKTLKCKI